tara:strand:- start:2683 stop:4809 length:2127 start_codon:yes stop_codon:yes gene_type:complete
MKKVVFTFGRMNPPTIGHEKLVNKLKSVASTENADARLYLSHTSKPGSDPLSYNDKIKFAQKAFGIAYKSSAKQIFQIAKEFQGEGYTDVIMVVGSDRVKEFDTLLKKYNGKGDYDFDSIKVVSAGQRDPDATGVEGMSGTKLRNLAKDGDMKQFMSGLAKGLSVADKKKIYALVSKNMKEAYFDVEMDDILTEAPLTVQQRVAKGRVMKRLAPKMARARAKAAKRMAAPRQLKMRAQKAAMVAVRKKVAGDRGINYNNLSPNDKIAVDKLVAKKKGLVAKIAKKLLPIVRKKEQARLKALHSKTEGFDISEEAEISLRNKASKSNISYEIIKEVYDRGLLYWEEDDSMNEQQYAFARVNSFISGGKSVVLDADLIDESLKDACWPDYEAIGTKKKNGKTVPNCVPKEEEKAPDIKKGDTIILNKAKRPYTVAGITDPKKTLPAETDKMVVKKITKSKQGRKAHLTYHDTKKRGGFAVYLDKMPDFMSVKISEEVDLDEAAAKIKGKVYKPGDKPPPGGWPKITFGTKRMPKNKKEEFDLDEMSWYKKVLAKIDQLVHPKGYDDIVKDYLSGMKDKKNAKNPSGLASKIAREYGIEARSVIQYINKLVSKGIIPKELKAGDFKMVKSIEEIVLKKKSSSERKLALKKKAKWAKTSGGKKSALKSKKRADKVKSGSIRVDKERSKTAKKTSKLYNGYSFKEYSKEKESK